MKTCPACGREVPADAKVCGYCGTRFEEAAAAAESAGTPASSGQGAVPVTPAPSAASRSFPWLAIVVVALLVGGGAFALFALQAESGPTSTLAAAAPTTTTTAAPTTTESPPTTQAATTTRATTTTTTAATTTTTTTTVVAYETIEELPYERFSMIPFGFPVVDCEEVGEAELSNGEMITQFDCETESPGPSGPFHIVHGYTGDSPEALEERFATFRLFIDGDLIEPDGEIVEEQEDGTVAVVSYYLFPDGFTGEHVFVAVWDIELYQEILNRALLDFG